MARHHNTRWTIRYSVLLSDRPGVRIAPGTPKSPIKSNFFGLCFPLSTDNQTCVVMSDYQSTNALPYNVYIIPSILAVWADLPRFTTFSTTLCRKRPVSADNAHVLRLTFCTHSVLIVYSLFEKPCVFLFRRKWYAAVMCFPYHQRIIYLSMNSAQRFCRSSWCTLR